MATSGQLAGGGFCEKLETPGGLRGLCRRQGVALLTFLSRAGGDGTALGQQRPSTGAPNNIQVGT